MAVKFLVIYKNIERENAFQLLNVKNPDFVVPSHRKYTVSRWTRYHRNIRVVWLGSTFLIWNFLQFECSTVEKHSLFSCHEPILCGIIRDNPF